MDAGTLLVLGLLVVSVANTNEATPFTGRDHSEELDSSSLPHSSGVLQAGNEPNSNKAVKGVNVADISKEHESNVSKTVSIPDTLSSRPEFTDEVVEKEYENGVIKGKYSYVDEDGIPTQIEYEAIPNDKFEVKKYIKGSKILPIPDINYYGS